MKALWLCALLPVLSIAQPVPDLKGGAGLRLLSGPIAVELMVHYVNMDKKGGLYFGIFSSGNAKDGSPNFYDNINKDTAEHYFGDHLNRTIDSIFGISYGGIYPIKRSLYAIGGFHLAMIQQYRNYQDEFRILGNNGSYWINGDKRKIIGLQLGMMVVKGVAWGMKTIYTVGVKSSDPGIILGAGVEF
jgi:hypothetical protein